MEAAALVMLGEAKHLGLAGEIRTGYAGGVLHASQRSFAGAQDDKVHNEMGRHGSCPAPEAEKLYAGRNSRNIGGRQSPVSIADMNKDRDDIQLVREAQRGHPDARSALVRVVEPRLAEYVGRLTLNRELTADLVQESIAEMFKIFDTLKDPQRFWCWLYTITLNKVRAHYRRRWQRKERSLSEVEPDWLPSKEQDVLAEMVAEELKQTVVRAVAELEPRQRAVLTLRCYDQMSYRQISQVMGCTQLGARALFHRAKKSIARLLNAHGIDKSALPVALLFFGKLSARSEAAAAAVSITASTLHVGPWVPLLSLAVQPAALVTLLGAVLLGVGGVVVTRPDIWHSAPSQAATPRQVPPTGAISQDASCWYYYPPATTDTVMIRTAGPAVAYRQWLQKEQANYFREGGTIYIRNHRQFASDLSVWRLPTDPPALRRFLQSQDRRALDLEYAAPSARGLLVAVEQAGADQRQQVTLSYDVSMEDYFRHDWSIGAALVDQRDEAHRRGWTYFTITGRLGTRQISGHGRLPFVAATAEDHGPWLELTLGDDGTILDAGHAAEIRDGSGMVTAHYPGGSFFQGLGRPWSGLHTIDTIRRDAARAGIVFATRPLPDGQRVELVLDGPGVRLTYRVHLYQDWIESITFSQEDMTIGEWTFSYPAPDEADLHRFMAPPSLPGRRGQSMPGGLWLMRLAQGSLAP
jgi:RNA polymerase sigma-70 factor (ECF subfamily)